MMMIIRVHSWTKIASITSVLTLSFLFCFANTDTPKIKHISSMVIEGRFRNPDSEKIVRLADSFYKKILRMKKIKRSVVIGGLSSLLVATIWYYLNNAKSKNENPPVRKESDTESVSTDSGDESNYVDYDDEIARLKFERLRDKKNWGSWAKRGLRYGLFGGLASAVTGVVLSIISGSGSFFNNKIRSFFNSADLRETFYLSRESLRINYKWISNIVVDLENGHVNDDASGKVREYYQEYLVQGAEALVQSIEAFAAISIAKSKHLFGMHTIEYQNVVGQSVSLTNVVSDLMTVLKRNSEVWRKTGKYPESSEVGQYMDILSLQLARAFQNFEKVFFL